MNRVIERGISCTVPAFPPPPAVTVSVDGRNLVAYVHAEIRDGRVVAPLSLVRMLVDRMWLDGEMLVVERAGRRARLPFTVRFAGSIDVSRVEIASLLRAVGDTVCYRASTRRLEVRTPRALPLASATPFSGAPVPARTVFTPEPVPTPRPRWSGSPLPRRTPLPQSPPPYG
ncbi:MAG: hypothetical protein JOY69_00875 [Candidatus Eremiobacteraeota bacterium]|nr:hypothetical protein [Candidatus Eremiobacteraeota bacterium]MBV8371786.1 hypothetical protein [Candidatus Eremiobacteraeota bacterium]